MKKLASLLVFVSLFIASPIMASEEFTIDNALPASDLLQKCKSASKYIGVEETEITKETMNLNACREFIRGVTNTNDLFVGMGWAVPKFCIPKEVGLDQLSEIVLKYLEETPKILRLSSVFAVQIALVRAFPCSESQPE